jgi:hypothetical protein
MGVEGGALSAFRRRLHDDDIMINDQEASMRPAATTAY